MCTDLSMMLHIGCLSICGYWDQQEFWNKFPANTKEQVIWGESKDTRGFFTVSRVGAPNSYVDQGSTAVAYLFLLHVRAKYVIKIQYYLSSIYVCIINL